MSPGSPGGMTDGPCPVRTDRGQSPALTAFPALGGGDQTRLGWAGGLARGERSLCQRRYRMVRAV